MFQNEGKDDLYMRRGRKKACLIALIMALIMTGCSNNDNDNSTEDNTEANQEETNVQPTDVPQENSVDENNGVDLTFDATTYTEGSMMVEGEAVNYRAFENIIYVGNPVDPQYQCMNIYIPEEYFNGESVGIFTADTAPIFFPNTVGGYMPGKPGTPSMEGSVGGDASRLGLTGNGENGNVQNKAEGTNNNGNETAKTTESGTNQTTDNTATATTDNGNAGNANTGVSGSESTGSGNAGGGNTGTTDTGESPNAILMALSKGYVVAAPGARGRTLQLEDGTYTGKAPAAIVDLKAAVRYLHFNDSVMPGDAKKIISNGTSAGGALSVLLGATGNNSEYEGILAEIGAANADDDIFAVSAYCPITNLDHADMAYEWMFHGINEYTSMNITVENGQINRQKETFTLSGAQTVYSSELKAAFSDYVNDLLLKDMEGNALTLDENGNGSFKDYVETFIMESAQAQLEAGNNLSNYDWIEVEDNVVTNIDFDGYIAYLSRSKGVPAFDSIDLSSSENSLFGTEIVDVQHFTEFSQDKDTTGGSMADEQIIRMMNPMNYIGMSGNDVAEYWRIRHGTMDSDTALAVPVILSNVLEENGYQVDFYLPWEQGHGGDYDLEELFDWMAEVTS